MVEMPASAQGSSGGSTNDIAKLQRRVMGLPRSQWSLSIDYQVIIHAGTARSLAALDELSDCLARVADHFQLLAAGEASRMPWEMVSYDVSNPPVLARLCNALGFCLQQLAEGVQQYLQQGQLPAALTVRAVQSCRALLYVLARVLNDRTARYQGWMYEQRQRRYLMLQDTGECVSRPTVEQITRTPSACFGT
jgi:hypothetical protein